MIERWDDDCHKIIEMWCRCWFDSKESQDVKKQHSQIKVDSKNHYLSSLNLTHFNFSNVLHNFTFFSIALCSTCDLINIK